MALPRSSALATILTAVIIAAALSAAAAPVVHGAYGYPAPRHSRRIAAAALAPEVSLSIIKSWLASVGLRNLTKSLDAAPANTSLRLLRMLENSSTPIAALAGAELVSALKTVAGRSPTIKAADVAGLIKTFIRSLNGTTYAWVGRYLMRALEGRASAAEAVSYVLTLTATRCVNASPEYLARLVVSIEVFSRYVSLGEYVKAANIVRNVAYNYSLIISVYMAEILPPEAFWEAGNPTQPQTLPGRAPAAGSATAPKELGGGSSITLGDVIKAILVLRRLGPKAISIIGKVSLPELVTAVKKVPVSLISNLSVNQLVSIIRNASKSPGGQPLFPFVNSAASGRGGGLGGPSSNQAAGRGGSGRVPPYIIINRRRYRSLRIPKLGSWGNSTLKVSLPSALLTVGKIYVNVSRVAAVVKAIMPAGSPLLKVEREALSKAYYRVRIVTVRRGSAATPAPAAPGIAAALGGAAVVALAAVIMVRRGRGGAEAVAPPPPLPRVGGNVPPVLREFWECVASLSSRFGARVNACMTHREVVDAVLEAAGAGAAALAEPLRRLMRIYEGVRFAGVRTSEVLRRFARQLADEVLRRASKA